MVRDRVLMIFFISWIQPFLKPLYLDFSDIRANIFLSSLLKISLNQYKITDYYIFLLDSDSLDRSPFCSIGNFLLNPIPLCLPLLTLSGKAVKKRAEISNFHYFGAFANSILTI